MQIEAKNILGNCRQPIFFYSKVRIGKGFYGNKNKYHKILCLILINIREYDNG